MYSQYLFYFLQFTVYVSHEFGNSQMLELTWLGVSQNTAIKSYSVRGLKISEELKRLPDDVYKFVKKTIYVKYFFKYMYSS